MGVLSMAVDGAEAVCRFYLPPPFGDSHFYSAADTECADVRVRFPGFVYESPAVFAVALPDAGGACPAGTLPVYRLWNARIDSNHRTPPIPRSATRCRLKGYVPEGYGSDAVAFCAWP